MHADCPSPASAGAVQVDTLVSTLKVAWGVSTDTVPPSPVPMKRKSSRQSFGQVGMPVQQDVSVSETQVLQRNSLMTASLKSLPRTSLESLAVMQVSVHNGQQGSSVNSDCVPRLTFFPFCAG